MTKQTLILKRHGALAVVRIDLVTERPCSVDELEGETPPGCVDKAMPVAQAEAVYGPYYTLKYLEAPRGPEKVAENTVSDAEIQAVLKAPPEQAPAAKTPHSLPPGEIKYEALPSNVAAEQQIIRELELMFAARSVATGKKRKELDADVNSVCNFLCRVFPHALPMLQQLSAKYSEVQRVQF